MITVTKLYKAKNNSGVASITALFIVSSAIIILGAVFSVYSVLNNISFSVMSAKIPAVLFGAVVVFLGARYFLATIKLWSKIKGQKFSWRNFRKQVDQSNVKGEA